MSEPASGPDRVVVVSGAGTGIGQVVATKFAARGWAVAIGGRRVSKLDETVNLIEKDGGVCFAHELDVTKAASVERFFAKAEEELGPVAAVINNAAHAKYALMDEFSPEEIESEIAAKLTGSLFMARQGILSMKRQGRGGDLLFVTSLAGVTPWPYHLPYAAANAGVEHAARTLRLELEGTGIRVNMVRCGETLGTDFAVDEYASGRMMAANEMWFRRGILRHTGLMTPDNVAEAIVTAVSLPAGHQYDVIAVNPVAPIGELPVTYDGWTADMARKFMPS